MRAGAATGRLKQAYGAKLARRSQRSMKVEARVSGFAKAR